jgi:hypothetical protein
MKFLASFFALALYFIFALAETADEITYPDPDPTVAAATFDPAPATDLTVAHTSTHVKAGPAF